MNIGAVVASLSAAVLVWTLHGVVFKRAAFIKLMKKRGQQMRAGGEKVGHVSQAGASQVRKWLK